MDTLADRALRRLREMHFNRAVHGVLAAPPARAADDGVVIFSMIGTRVVLAYLVAAKSLHAQLGRGRFAILDDGTLTSADKALLAAHLSSPEIFDIAAVDVGQCPRGGCWERLLTLLELRRDNYVIQLDSDTVTLGPVSEIAVVMDKMTGRPRGFAFATMNTEDGAKAAILALNGKDWKGRSLTVNEARPRAERPAGGYGDRTSNR